MFYDLTTAKSQFSIATPVVYAYNLKEHYENMENTVNYMGAIRRIGARTKVSVEKLIKDSIEEAQKNEENYFKIIKKRFKHLKDFDDFIKMLNDKASQAGAGFLKDLEIEIYNTTKGSIAKTLKRFKNTHRLGKEKTSDGKYVNVEKFKEEQTFFLELFKTIIKEYLRLGILQGSNDGQVAEAEFIITYIDGAIEDLSDIVDLDLKSIEGLAKQLAYSVARSYEIFGAAVLSEAFDGSILLVGKAGQSSKGSEKNFEVIINENKKRISRHIDSLVDLSTLNNKMIIALDTKSSSGNSYSYNQSDSLQTIFAAAEKNGFATNSEIMEFLAVFVNMAYFEPTQAETIDPLNEFIKNYLAINFAEQYVEFTMADKNIIPVVQINFIHYRVSELLKAFLSYTSTSDRLQKVDIPDPVGAPQPGPYGNYLQGGVFGKMLVDKRDTISKLLKGKKKETETDTEPFYYQVFKKTKKHHIKITENILNKKQRTFLQFSASKHLKKK
jgi:hypothetical protein